MSNFNFKPFLKFGFLLGSIVLTNITVHTICCYMGCHHWTYLFGHNLICNACIDFSKMIKDYQFMMYGTAATSFALKMNQFIIENNIEDQLKKPIT